jgi:hypothetical protein
LHGQRNFAPIVTVEAGHARHQGVRGVKGTQPEWFILDRVERVAVGIVVLIEPSAVDSVSLAGTGEAVAKLDYHSASVDVVRQVVA